MLCSVDFNDSVAVLTLLYLLLAHTGSVRCSHSERVPVLNPEVLPYWYLRTMLLNMLFITLTMLPLFFLSLQAPFSRTCHKFFPLSYRIPLFYPSISHSVSGHQYPPSAVTRCQSPSLRPEFYRSTLAPWVPGLGFEESPLLGTDTCPLMPVTKTNILNE